MTTFIYFMEKKQLAKFKAEGRLDHDQAISLLKANGIRPTGAVMLIYSGKNNDS